MANRYEQIQLDSEYQNLLSEIEDLKKERVYYKHDLAHFMDVARIASLIWIEEGSSVELNKDIIYAAALLHDIGRVIEYNEGISHDETVALLSKLDVDKHISVEIKLDELDLTSAESKASYAQIKEYILEKFDLKVSTLYIAQIKKKCGIVLRENYNKSKKEKQVIPQCTPEKEEAIMDALRYFKMI